MHERDLLPILLTTAIAGPILAKLVAARLGRVVDAVPGQTRRHMPSLPVDTAQTTGSARQDASAARRFEGSVRAAERQAVVLLTENAADDTVVTLEASQLATQLGVHGEVATALLADWRARLPCRLRVTQGGSLLHDFKVEALHKAVKDGMHSWPQRMALFALAVLANLGALWWVVVGVAVGTVALRAVWQGEEQDEQLKLAAFGIIEFIGVYVAAQLGAWLVAVVLRSPGPKLAAVAPKFKMAKPGEALPVEKSKRKLLRRGKQVEPAPVVDAGVTADDVVAILTPEITSSSRSGSWLPSSLDLDVDGEGCVFVLLIIAVAILVALVAGGLAVVGIWMVGLWRAVKRLGEPERHLAPVAWLQRGERASAWERWLPTNDLALRLTRALRRIVAGRPGDDALATRILARVKRQNGSVAAIEIALDEALDIGEALSVGTRMVALHGGDIAVSEAGDIDLQFPPEVWQQADDAPPPLPLEYLGVAGRKLAEPERLAVNIPGLTLDHLGGAMRLAGGPWATLVAMAAVIATQAGALPVRGLDLSMGLLFCVLSPGTLILAAVAERAMRQTVRVGLLRDVRRVTVQRVRDHLAGVQQAVNVMDLTKQLREATALARPGWDDADIAKEVEAMLADLGLEPGITDKNPGQWSLHELRARMASLQALRANEVRPVQADANVVVFDSGAPT